MRQKDEQKHEGQNDRDDLLGRGRKRQEPEHQKNTVNHEGQNEQPDEEGNQPAAREDNGKSCGEEVHNM